MLMCSPYETREEWLVSAIKHKGTIYLHKEETETKVHNSVVVRLPFDLKGRHLGARAT